MEQASPEVKLALAQAIAAANDAYNRAFQAIK